MHVPKQIFNSMVIREHLEPAHKALAEVKALCAVLDPVILHENLTFPEAVSSCAIENLDSMVDIDNYLAALDVGVQCVKDNKFLSNNVICEMQSNLCQNEAGFRTTPGTILRDKYFNVVYVPPQDPKEIVELMNDLEHYINHPDGNDPLVRLALIHFVFESIHPFYDGNGRTGRIIMQLNLMLEDVLDLPVLPLSTYIDKHRTEYYTLLQNVRLHNTWEAWIVWILTGITESTKWMTDALQDI